MSFKEAIKSCFSNFINVDGRASKSEFLCWCLFIFIASIANTVLVKVTGFNIAKTLLNDEKYGVDIYVLFALLNPTVAVSVRRLHDIGKSDRWILITLTCIGIIPFFIWCFKEDEERENQYGDNPLPFQPLPVD